MAKEAYYFSHDSNARHDPKITAMRGVYGSEGYGWFWMLIEMMRESEGYKLDLRSKYTWNAFALQLQAESKRVEQFVQDCIHEFDLFEADDNHFWSPSLLRRMEIREQISESRRKASKVRWDKEKQSSDEALIDAKGMQMHSNADANGMQGKERKVKEREKKLKESKKDNTFSAYTSNTDLVETLESFVEFRKQMKKPLTDRGIKLLLGKLDKLASNDEEKIAILEQSILMGWQGIFELKDKGRFERPKSGSPQGRQKPTIPIVSSSPAPSVSPEELEELQRLARKLDGKHDGEF